MGCSPKTTPPTEEITKEQSPPPKKQAPENPCRTFDDLDPAKRDEVETAYVLYKDKVKEKNYKDALPLWQTAYYGAPGSNGRVKYQFDDGVAIYTYLYQNEKDPGKKAAYIDSVMSIYDKRIECFGDAAYISGRKAFDYYYTFPGRVDEQVIYDLFKKNLDVKGKKADYFVINPFTKLLVDGVTSEKIPLEEGRKYAKLIQKAIKYGTANCKGSYCEAWKTIADYAPQRLESLEGVDGFYDCVYYTNKYYPQFEASPQDCDVIALVARRLKRGGCANDQPELSEVLKAYNTHCKKTVASPTSSVLREGYQCYQNGDYKCAVQKFNEYIDSATDPQKKAKYAMLIAKIYYGDIKNFPKARKYALEAAKYRPGWGDPFLLIGKLYASSGPLCGTGRGWNSQVVTWVAIDKFKHAKSIDPSVASEANKLISKYRQYMPKKEDVFQKLLKPGQSYTVPCWIQEKTTIRTVD